MSETSVQMPTHSQFLANANTRFRWNLGNSSEADLALIDVSELTENGLTRSFSLLFRAPGDVPPEQSIYRLSHDTLGAMELFLVPVKQDSEGIYFESIFNDLVAQAG